MASREITIGELLEAILDSQNRCNNLIGAVHNLQIEQAKQMAAQKHALDRWKEANPELAGRCRESLEKLNTFLEAYLTWMMNDIEDIDSLDSEFPIREFLDKYGHGYMQLNGMIQALSQLAS